MSFLFFNQIQLLCTFQLVAHDMKLIQYFALNEGIMIQ